MKKKLFSIVFGISSLFLMSSCGSDDPAPVIDYTANAQIKQTMQANYYWGLPQNPNQSLETPEYFKSLINPEDKVSEMVKISDIVTEARYDLGFDYAANRYESGIVYYVIYYVKPNTSAYNAELKRGYMISKVNGTPVTEDNKLTLLKNAAKDGKQINLTVFIPDKGKELTVTITPSTNIQENPIYESPDTKPILSAGNSKVGYFVYNIFEANFDKQLVAKLQTFNNQVEYLVIDLRYNIGGSFESALTLASALVKDRTDKDVFLINEKRSDLESKSYPLKNTITSGEEIPKLGNQLKKVYVITGQNTQGIADAFINGLRPYLQANLVVVGEKSVGTNVTEGYSDIENTWKMHIVTGKWASKDGNSVFNTTPNIKVNDINREVVVPLFPLGNPDEVILAAVLANIKGDATSRSTTNFETVKIVSPSLIDKAKKYPSTMELK